MEPNKNRNHPEEIQQPHELKLDNRGRLSVSGVGEVESFDESAVVLKTVRGLLVVRGEKLQLQALSIDGGQISVHGLIDSLCYEEEQKTTGFFKRLFR